MHAPQYMPMARNTPNVLKSAGELVTLHKTPKREREGRATDRQIDRGRECRNMNESYFITIYVTYYLMFIVAFEVANLFNKYVTLCRLNIFKCHIPGI